MKYILSIIIIVIIFSSITSLIFPNIRKKRNISVKQARIILRVGYKPCKLCKPPVKKED